MKGRIIALTVAVTASTVMPVVSMGASIETAKRYSIIGARLPFGAPPPEPRKAPAPSAPKPTTAQLGFAKYIRLAYMRRRRGAVRVGLYDNKTKTSMLMTVGDEQDGITLVEADYEQGKVLLRKGAVEQWVSRDSKAKSAAPTVTSSVASRPHSFPKRISYTERIRRRREAKQAVIDRAKQKPKLTGVELNHHLEDYQMELIRSGGSKGPPLPLPLTKDMDDQLVSEGVLPPM